MEWELHILITTGYVACVLLRRVLCIFVCVREVTFNVVHSIYLHSDNDIGTLKRSLNKMLCFQSHRYSFVHGSTDVS